MGKQPDGGSGGAWARSQAQEANQLIPTPTRLGHAVAPVLERQDVANLDAAVRVPLQPRELAPVLDGRGQQGGGLWAPVVAHQRAFAVQRDVVREPLFGHLGQARHARGQATEVARVPLEEDVVDVRLVRPGPAHHAGRGRGLLDVARRLRTRGRAGAPRLRHFSGSGRNQLIMKAEVEGARRAVRRAREASRCPPVSLNLRRGRAAPPLRVWRRPGTVFERRRPLSEPGERLARSSRQKKSLDWKSTDSGGGRAELGRRRRFFFFLIVF